MPFYNPYSIISDSSFKTGLSSVLFIVYINASNWPPSLSKILSSLITLLESNVIFCAKNEITRVTSGFHVTL